LKNAISQGFFEHKIEGVAEDFGGKKNEESRYFATVPVFMLTSLHASKYMV